MDCIKDPHLGIPLHCYYRFHSTYSMCEYCCFPMSLVDIDWQEHWGLETQIWTPSIIWSYNEPVYYLSTLEICKSINVYITNHALMYIYLSYASIQKIWMFNIKSKPLCSVSVLAFTQKLTQKQQITLDSFIRSVSLSFVNGWYRMSTFVKLRWTITRSFLFDNQTDEKRQNQSEHINIIHFDYLL